MSTIDDIAEDQLSLRPYENTVGVAEGNRLHEYIHSFVQEGNAKKKFYEQ